VQVHYRTTEEGEWEDLRQVFTDYRLLTTEVGIYLTAVAEEGEDALPDFLRDLDTLQLLITGTITSDYRIGYRTDDKSAESPVSGEIERLIRAHTQFFDRKREVDGDNASILTGAADERTDTAEIEEYAETLVKQETLSNVAADITLSGLQLE